MPDGRLGLGVPGRVALGDRSSVRYLVDAATAANLLGVPKTWVLAQARADRIPHVRLGRYVRFEPAQLETWWRARRRGPITGGRQAAA